MEKSQETFASLPVKEHHYTASSWHWQSFLCGRWASGVSSTHRRDTHAGLRHIRWSLIFLSAPTSGLMRFYKAVSTWQPNRRDIFTFRKGSRNCVNFLTNPLCELSPWSRLNNRKNLREANRKKDATRSPLLWSWSRVGNTSVWEQTPQLNFIRSLTPSASAFDI